MTQPSEPDQPSPLLTELRWFARLRWLAGIVVIVATASSAVATGWSVELIRYLSVGVAILTYNVVFWDLLRRAPHRDGTRERHLLPLAWGQLLADLTALTLLVMWTGGLASPLLLAFVFHMVFASLLLPQATAYVAMVAAAIMVALGLALTGQWPADRGTVLMGLAWVLALMLTIYLTNHITSGLRAHQAELRRQNRHTRGILEAATDGIVTIDEEGIIRSVNPAAEEIFGYEAAEMVGRNISMLMPEPYHSEHDDYIANYHRTGRPKIIGIGREVAGRRADGTVFPIELAVSEVPVGDQRIFTGLVRDITDRKRAEAELRELNDQLLRQQSALVQHEKMAAMGQMAAGVAHEIANPLASMDSVLQLVARHPDRLGAETAGTLRQQVNRINELVRRMKDFAHPVETSWERVPINEVVEAALDTIRFDQRTRRVDITRELDADAGCAEVMPHTIQQVVINLVLNALDAVVGVADPQIVVATRPNDAGCVIEVRDNGKGIAHEDLNRIFEPFFTTKPVGQGTGLGLSISYSLVERNHGRLDVTSRRGEGTTFSIHLPASGRRERPSTAVPTSESPAE
jgi:two-component system sensor kinase FixL